MYILHNDPLQASDVLLVRCCYSPSHFTLSSFIEPEGDDVFYFPPQGSKYSLLMLEGVKGFCKGGDMPALNMLKKQENAMCGLRHFIPLRSL